MIEKISDMLAFAKPLRVIERPDSLVILDSRPTWVMAIAGGGFVVIAAIFVVLLYNIRLMGFDSFGLWATGIIAAACLVFALPQTIREVYYFDLATDSYRFERRYLYRKDVIEGGLDQFTSAYVKTIEGDESQSYFVALRQEGIFLTGMSEQTLREETPIFNSFSNECRIANAISTILSTARTRREKKPQS